MSEQTGPDPEVLNDQGRDGGDQHPGDAVLESSDPEIGAVMAGLVQADSELKDEEQ